MPSESCSHLNKDIPLTNENTKNEEASKKVEAVNDSEEDFTVTCIVLTSHAIMVAMEEIVKAGESPQDAEDEKEFPIENLNTETTLKCQK